MENTLTIQQKIYKEFWKLGLLDKAEEYANESGLTLKEKEEVLESMKEGEE